MAAGTCGSIGAVLSTSATSARVLPCACSSPIIVSMRVFQGMVGRRRSNSSVAPRLSTTQLSLSTSMMVLSKSNTTMIPAISLFLDDKGLICWLRG
uniref:Uncharacterized protein n=1 Tax=Arundo donax TaxID=35708 RepID=A0A0A9H6U3_ARUDO